MNMELVKLGAGALGWRVRAVNDYFFEVLVPEHGWRWDIDLMFHAYMAEALTQLVCVRGDSVQSNKLVLSVGVLSPQHSWLVPVPIRIAMSLYALDVITLERARELVRDGA